MNRPFVHSTRRISVFVGTVLLAFTFALSTHAVSPTKSTKSAPSEPLVVITSVSQPQRSYAYPPASLVSKETTRMMTYAGGFFGLIGLFLLMGGLQLMPRFVSDIPGRVRENTLILGE